MFKINNKKHRKDVMDVFLVFLFFELISHLFQVFL